METIPSIKVEVSKIQALEVKPHIELMEEKVRTIEPKVCTEPLVVVLIETTKIVVEKLNA